jgi:hypothetical protein
VASGEIELEPPQATVAHPTAKVISMIRAVIM